VRHVLDWFHLSMRIQHVAQAVKGWASAVPAAAERTAALARPDGAAPALIDTPLTDLDSVLETADNQPARKVAALLHGLETYLAGQADLIIDYATARRRGEPISTATTEGTVQRLLHRRRGANQQMRWSPRGAHRMLKVRTATMNGTLASDHAAAEPYARRPFHRAA
jgi:hypothetical protein